MCLYIVIQEKISDLGFGNNRSQRQYQAVHVTGALLLFPLNTGIIWQNPRGRPGAT